MTRRRRVALLLVVLLGSSVTAAAGVWKRLHEGTRERGVPTHIEERRIPPWRADGRDGGAGRADAAVAAHGAARTFRGDAARRHRSGEVGPSEPRAVFELPAGGPIAAMPVIAPGGDVIVATLAGKVMRVSPSGAVAWTADLEDRVYATPLVTDDAVLVGSDADLFFSLALADGKRRWALRVDGDCDTPAAEGARGAILVGAGSTLYAVRRSGTILWRVRARGEIHGAPAVAGDGAVYVGAQDHHLYAIGPDGAVRWRRDLGADVDGAPAIGDAEAGGAALIYVGSDAGQVTAFDPDGAVRWRTEVGGLVRGGLTVGRDGVVLAGTSGRAPRVVALDGATGAERWSFRIEGAGAREGGVRGGPLEDAEGNLYFGAQDDRIYALDRAGRLRWTRATGGRLDAPLALGPGGVLYAGSGDGKLYALH